MFRHRELGLIQAYQVGITGLVTVLFWVYFLVLDHVVPGFQLHTWTNYLGYYAAIVVGLQISFSSAKNYDVFSVSSGIVESHRFVWPHMVFAIAITGMFVALTRDATMSRFFLFTFLPGAYVAMVVFSRYFALAILKKFVARRGGKMLLVGEPASLEKVQSLLEKAKLFGIEPAGLLTEAEANRIPCGIPKLGGIEDFEKHIQSRAFSNVLILGSPRDRRVLATWMRAAESGGCRLSLVNDLDEFLQRRVSYFRCDNIDLIELREEPLQNPVNRALKRLLDIAVSLPVVCLVLPPLALAVWTVQRTQAPGALFFRQTRSGMNNQPFTILKFRTMYADRCDSSEQATLGDARIFPAGRILRKFSLDEFPQFLNVLMGQMSLVGPRPHMPEHDRLFGETLASYPVRGFVKPGLTGLAQTHGFRGEAVTREDIVRRVECDIEYIETWSFMLDLALLWRTAAQLVRPPKTAY